MCTILQSTFTKIFAQMSRIYRLSTILAACYRRNDLRHDRTCHLKAFWTLDQLAIHNGAVVEHITNIDQTAVEDRLNKIVHIMEM